MPIVLKKSASQLVADAMAQVRTLSLDEARALHASAGALFVDLRDVRELEREGVIPGAAHAPRGMLEFWVDPASPYFHKAFAGVHEGQPMVLFCAAGWRSALATKALVEMGFPAVSHIEGGFSAWKAAGAPVAERAPARPKPGG
ncbi:MAG: rhodanese-like domain-containing protein [Betaproteobacteria bacterium]|nr:rhodanese-like domain-containing protein [Betaproteobacteria bacterium]MCC6248103.1 rhodanese-like domain-containing protein [Rubrivivax sp.]MCL4696441.1 rhodanese-like domain-containing protein [Burkholderiaceae bacterium]